MLLGVVVVRYMPLLLICSNEMLNRYVCYRFLSSFLLSFDDCSSVTLVWLFLLPLYFLVCWLHVVLETTRKESLFSLFARKCKRWTRTTATSWWAKSNGWVQKQGWRSIVLKKIRIAPGRACVSESLKLTMDCELAQRNQSIEITASPTMVHVSEL